MMLTRLIIKMCCRSLYQLWSSAKLIFITGRPSGGKDLADSRWYSSLQFDEAGWNNLIVVYSASPAIFISCFVAVSSVFFLRLQSCATPIKHPCHQSSRKTAAACNTAWSSRQRRAAQCRKELLQSYFTRLTVSVVILNFLAYLGSVASFHIATYFWRLYNDIVPQLSCCCCVGPF